MDKQSHSRIVGYQRFVFNLLSRKYNWPVGHCLRDIYDRGLYLSSNLVEELNRITKGKKYDPAEIALKWLECNDARAYALIGDPAARVRLD
jgi:hypothetical protein